MARDQEYTIEETEYFSKWCWKNWIATCKIMKVGHSLTLYIYKEAQNGLNVRPKSISERGHRTLFGINFRSIFNLSPRQ